MAQIQKLPQELIARIAAGQVVERPASVVKELIENSLDAGAKHIRIELESAGKKKIVVVDDGIGMSQEDLSLCFLHHATSKISDISDLLAIQTFGFRGEALSSMCAVAQVRIESKLPGSLAGKYIEVERGIITKTGSVGMPTGTRVTVSGLFAVIPARKKFLKSDTTELAHCLQVITEIALANPQISFTVSHNKKIVLELPSDQTILERVAHLLSDHIAENLLPLSIQSDHFFLSGFVGKPQIGTQSQLRQFLFVNKRSVLSKEISQIVKETFSTLLEPRSYPAFLFNIHLNPELIDINVDPQKTRIKFLIETEIIKELNSAIRSVLEQANLTYEQRGNNGFYDEFLMDPGIAKLVKESGDGWNIKDVELATGAEVLQIHNLYLVTQTKRGVLIVDQHAAHERILYQEFLEKFEKERNDAIVLSEPIRVELPVAEAEFLKTELAVFSKLGFVITEEISQKKKDQTNFLVKQIPKVFKTRNIKRLIQEILHDSVENKNPKELDVGTHRTLAYLACRTAIKSGEKLTPKQRKRLLEKLQQTEGKYTCPHGRPVEVELDVMYLDQLFKRVK
ncbi:MAG: DNA mismatch repair protein MutL [Patescibacteria group bacterium]|nr:MAG: DNA mismatch repair protein MutL [Patescibacteria group bacterium]